MCFEEHFKKNYTAFTTYAIYMALIDQTVNFHLCQFYRIYIYIYINICYTCIYIYIYIYIYINIGIYVYIGIYII